MCLENYNTEFHEMTKVEWTSLKKGLTLQADFIAHTNETLAQYLKSRAKFQKHTQKKFFIQNPTKEDPVEKVRKKKCSSKKQRNLGQQNKQNMKLNKQLGCIVICIKYRKKTK